MSQAFSGTTWNRCRVHFIRNLLAHIPKGNKSMVAAALRTLFAQPDRPVAGQQLAAVVQAMRPRRPKTTELLERAEEDILAFMTFPIEHWRRIYSTNPLERLNKEIKRRANVVGIFPDQASVIRLVGSILMEVSDEWQIGRRYLNRESMKKVMEPEPLLIADQAPFCLAPVH